MTLFSFQALHYRRRQMLKQKKNLQKHKPDEMKKSKAPFHLEVRQEQGADDQLFYMSLPLGKIDCASFCQTRCP